MDGLFSLGYCGGTIWGAFNEIHFTDWPMIMIFVWERCSMFFILYIQIYNVLIFIKYYVQTFTNVKFKSLELIAMRYYKNFNLNKGVYGKS